MIVTGGGTHHPRMQIRETARYVDILAKIVVTTMPFTALRLTYK
jgi:hypothetical protein